MSLFCRLPALKCHDSLRSIDLCTAVIVAEMPRSRPYVREDSADSNAPLQLRSDQASDTTGSLRLPASEPTTPSVVAV